MRAGPARPRSHPPRSRPPGYGSSLSPREHQVAGLLTAGATNQRIAEALSLSPRTVENHVAKVLKKLGTGRKRVAAVYSAGPDCG
ncbi:helix-turn-helix domain-containing protein [Kitasatospora acidiphila]|uniref:helix-turn-helix domain-containing protein n=1 Tax=Kitasatospora acidiphila TaxID=2567942 RepID=UPI001E634B8A|nr:helix-turn-helix transcriptional regulator [Kitasatospora acidiphila]